MLLTELLTELTQLLLSVPAVTRMKLYNDLNIENTKKSLALELLLAWFKGILSAIELH